jgi:hypothetical protein
MRQRTRFAIGYALAVAGFGAMLNATVTVLHARGASLDLPMPVLIKAHDPRPSRWCGWWLRQKLGVRDRRYNLARAWARLGAPAAPGAGVVVVWRHHVGQIVRVTSPRLRGGQVGQRRWPPSARASAPSATRSHSGRWAHEQAVDALVYRGLPRGHAAPRRR